MSGTYTNTFDLTLATTYNAAFITANGGTVANAEAAFLKRAHFRADLRQYSQRHVSGR